jgi:threonine/homoserine/homoserine lactone efflux protein
VPASDIAAFWIVALLLIVVPGADWAFTISAGLRGNSTMPAVSGLVIGYAGITVIVAAGVGALVARTPALLTALTVTGGLYLMWHGARTFTKPARPPPTPACAPAATARATILRGIGVSALNPKGLLIFLALLPQFTSPRWAWPLPAQLGGLGLIFMLTVAVFYLCLGSFTKRIFNAAPASARIITRFSGAAMFVIGAILLTERLLA